MAVKYTESQQAQIEEISVVFHICLKIASRVSEAASLDMHEVEDGYEHQQFLSCLSLHPRSGGFVCGRCDKIWVLEATIGAFL